MVTKSVKYLKFKGALYTRATFQKLDVEDRLLKKEDSPVFREIDTGILHAKSVVAEATKMLQPAKKYLAELQKLRAEVGRCIRKDRPHARDISILDPDKRAEVSALVKTIEKYNRALNFTADAMASVYDHITDQVDALSDDHGAAATALTGPASDNKLKSDTVFVMDNQPNLDDVEEL